MVHRALETVFASATKALEEDLVNVRSLVLDLLEDLESNIGVSISLGAACQLRFCWRPQFLPNYDHCFNTLAN